MVLRPGVSVVRKIDVGPLIKGLEDGKYRIRMRPTGCRWWLGELGKYEDEDWRMPVHLCEDVTVPLMLESQDEIRLCIRNEKVIQSI